MKPFGHLFSHNQNGEIRNDKSWFYWILKYTKKKKIITTIKERIHVTQHLAVLRFPKVSRSSHNEIKFK